MIDDRQRALYEELRTLVSSVDLADAASDARACRRELLATLDDLLLPRLSGDVPVLAVVAGATGAGKSTLVNSLVRSQVSVAGVLRPTTRSPVLVCHPSDAEFYRSGRVLADLRRVASPEPDPETLMVVATTSMPRGLAVVDAPDVDSLAEVDRGLAARLLAAADLWLFVTTAERYADAMVWRHLDTARDRDVALVLVVDRVPREAMSELQRLVAELLDRHGLGSTPVFTVAETTLETGLLSEFDVVLLRDWLHRIAAEPAMHSAVVQRTLAGTLRQLPGRVRDLADVVATRREEAAAREARRTAIVDDAIAGVVAALTAIPPAPPPEPARRHWWSRRLPAPTPPASVSGAEVAELAGRRAMRRAGVADDELPESVRAALRAAGARADTGGVQAAAGGIRQVLEEAVPREPAPAETAERLRALADRLDLP